MKSFKVVNEREETLVEFSDWEVYRLPGLEDMLQKIAEGVDKCKVTLTNGSLTSISYSRNY